MKGDAHFMLAFEGSRAPLDVLTTLAEGDAPGVTLYRHSNVESAAQVAELTDELHRAAGEPPLLVAADQETGQLMGLGPDTTQFPGAMALGAADDPALTGRVAAAVGTELRALGVTLNYAPVCDVVTNPSNPSLGVRGFSDDPARVATMAAATVRGLASAGVAATAKHFPGKGEASVDPHRELPLLDLERSRLDAVELEPFRAAIEAEVPVVMVGHYDLPAVTGRRDLPSSVSTAVVEGLLRADLGFDGVAITDALDMGALPQGVGQIVDAIAAIRAGVDLLLCSPDRGVQQRLRQGIDLAVDRGLVSPTATRERVGRLRRWLAGFSRPDRDVVGCAEHRVLAREVALRSVTLIRDDPSILPLEPSGSILAVMPRPADLTPADTSSTVAPGLASALRSHHPDVTEVVTSSVPTGNEISGAARQAEDASAVVVATLTAGPEQAALVEALASTGTPVVSVAARTPFDLAAYPKIGTHLCTYSIQPASMEALAEVVLGITAPRGRLPVAIPGLYDRGHGIVDE